MKMYKPLILLFAVASIIEVQAQDRQFNRTYQSSTLPKGQSDIEIWNTFRFGRNDFFTRLDQRAEFETGLTDKLQTAIYLNATHKSFVNPGDTTFTMQHKSEYSFSSEWKRKFSDPTVHPVGFALYGEVTLATNELELEPKIILDKNIGKHKIAFNAVAEFEYELEPEGSEIELELEATPLMMYLGYMYTFTPTFGLGFEALNHYEITPSAGLKHAAIFAGPTVYWSAGKGFIILNFLPQLMNLNSANVPGALDLDEYERYNVRLFFGFGL